MFFSSGTTGLPKLVMFSHRALCAHLDIISATRLSKALPKLDHNDICLSVLPYFHAGGLLTALVMLAQGVRLIVWRQFERAKLFEMIHKYNVTVLSVVPVILEAMANVDVQLEETLRYIFVGGDRLAAEIVNKMEKRLAPEQHIVQCKQSFC